MKKGPKFAVKLRFSCSVLAFLLLFGCKGCESTFAAGKRRMAKHQLDTCRRGLLLPSQAKGCYEQEHIFCLDAGLERTCGEGI